MKSTLIIKVNGTLRLEAKRAIQESISEITNMNTLVLDENVTDLIVLKENGEYENLF
jgi:hypothetical protein